MSGSARTTTYVSAAETRTARVARTTTGSPGAARPAGAVARPGGRGRRDPHVGPEVAQFEGVGRVVLGGEERTGQLGPAQFPGLRGDGEPGLHRLTRVVARQDLLDQVAGELGGDLPDHLAVDPALLPQLGVLRLGQQL